MKTLLTTAVMALALFASLNSSAQTSSHESPFDVINPDGSVTWVKCFTDNTGFQSCYPQ